MRAISALPLLVLLVAANDADDAAAPHDLALVANPFYRCSNLHRRPFLFLRHNPPAPDVHGRYLDLHAIADEDPHEIAIHAIRDVRGHRPATVQLHAIHHARQHLGDDTGYRRA